MNLLLYVCTIGIKNSNIFIPTEQKTRYRFERNTLEVIFLRMLKDSKLIYLFRLVTFMKNIVIHFYI